MQTSSLCTRSLNQGRRLRDFSTAYDATSRLPNLAKSPQRREPGQGDTAIDWRVGAGALSQARQHQVTVGGACRATGEVPREQMLVLFGAATMHAPGKPTGCPRTPPSFCSPGTSPSCDGGRDHGIRGRPAAARASTNCRGVSGAEAADEPSTQRCSLDASSLWPSRRSTGRRQSAGVTQQRRSWISRIERLQGLGCGDRCDQCLPL